MNKECTKFLRMVRLAFPTFHKKERKFYNDFSSTIREYEEEHPDCTQNDLIEQFGYPKDIVIMYYNNMDSGVYYTILKRTHYVKYTFIASIIVLAVLLITTLCLLYSAKKSFNNTIIDHVETTITESTTN